MQSKKLIQYKWKMGVYDLEDIYLMVRKGYITEQDFFDITRYNYNAAMERYNLDDIKKI